MYRKRLWKPIMAGTLALTMLLTPLGTGSVAVSAAEVETGDIPLTREYFSSEVLRKYLSIKVDKNSDGILSLEERNACLSLDIDGKEVGNAGWLQYFTELQEFKCRDNLLTKLDVSNNTKLTVLDCGSNDLTKLDVSNNTLLTTLNCNANALDALDVSRNTELTKLDCNLNNVETLDVSNNTKLTELICNSNLLKTLDVSNNTELVKLECGWNKLLTLDVSRNTKLTTLDCGGNKLVCLDVSKNTLLSSFDCDDNSRDARLTLTRQYDLSSFSGFDVSKMSALSGGTCVETLLTFQDDTDTVSYTYDCGNGYSADFTINKMIVYAENITLNKTSATVEKGKTLQLTATVLPEDTTNKKVKWLSSDNKIATVSDTGLVTAVGSGTAIISCLSTDGREARARCEITVPTLATNVALNKTSATLFKGKTLQLTATVTPTNVTNKAVTWKSSNTKIATVSSSGKVTAKAAGTATITCTAADGSGAKATCKITVKNPVTKVKLNKTQATLSPKATLQLKATVTPSNASNKAVTWSSSNMRVATVSSSGKVTARQAGTVTITCMAKDGSGVKATCKITVYTNTEAFVARIYTKALGRNAEADGLKYWAKEIESGRKTPTQVAESFILAPEFTNKNLSNAEYVKVLYRTFMGREYDQGGLDYWIARLNKGESRKSVLESFAGCQEFKDIVASFGL